MKTKKKISVVKFIGLYILAFRIYWHNIRLKRHTKLMKKHLKFADMMQLSYSAGFYSYKRYFKRLNEIKENVDVSDDSKWKPTLTDDELITAASKMKMYDKNGNIIDNCLQEEGVLNGNN